MTERTPTVEDVRICTDIVNGEIVTFAVADVRYADDLLPWSVRLYDIFDRTIPAEEGTAPSPIICGGEILETGEIVCADEIP